MRRLFTVLLPVWIVLTCAPQAALAQNPSASLKGTVFDATRAPIPGAQIVIAADGRSSGASATTDERGAFEIAVPLGLYIVNITAAGFAEQTQRMDLTKPVASLRDFTLKVADLKEAVTVTARDGGYQVSSISATKTPTALVDVPQSITVATQELIRNQMMTSVGDVMRYVPGVSVHQGENNRDQLVIRGNSTSADFFLNGVRDDVQYYRDLYNLSRIEVLKGPNAMTFGRGGAGGVVNRVEKEAMFEPAYEVSLQGGSYANRRFTTDLDQPLSDKVAFRLNGLFEDSDSFRSDVGLKRYGVTPTVTFVPSARTRIAASYEYLNDSRVADRGITSSQGRPVDVDRSTFYGNPADSHVDANVHIAHVTIDHRMGGFVVRNNTSIARYDRSYQNYVPGAVSANQALVALTAYNNATERTNVFNQTDFTYVGSTGAIRHTVLAGGEIGRQLTDNFRNTGYFNNTATSVSIPFASTMVTTPVTFRQSATDADNHLTTNLAAAYIQDQVELSRYLQLVGGVRFDRFDLTYHDNRSGLELARPDNLVSPRAGIVVKPIAALSVYSSYGVSYLPSSGDQFASLTTITQQVQPERFNNYEVGMKWDVRPDFNVTTAVYRLDRTNTRSTDPNDPTGIIQTGSQRTNGYELGANGQLSRLWSIAGGYAYQDAFVTSATTNAAAGAQVGQVPHHALSLWNRYQFAPRIAAGVGVLYRSDMFVAVDNTVTLPGYVRVDGAFFYSLGKQVRLQANLENLFDQRYFINADSNTNISPGSPRAVRVGLTTTF
jgi:catecholate siderophore receptor